MLLLNLYEQERNWRRAIDIARELDRDLPTEKRKHASEIANFFCELASDEMAKGQSEEAFAHLAQALRESAACIRANLLRGQWCRAIGKHREAIAAWKAIEAQDASYLGLAANDWLASHEALGEREGAEGLAELTRMQAAYPSLDLFGAIFRATLAAKGADAGYELVKEDLRVNPTLVGLDHLLEARILAATDERKADLEILKQLVHSHASKLAVYLCKSCGFKAKQWYWHCPACLGWDTFPPRRTAEYDTAERHLARLQAEHIENQKRRKD
jgi:lipopolysaccharide assembly protein B